MPSQYANFVDVFSPKLAIEFPEYIRINNHAIELVDDWQSLYSLTYSLRLVELETLKAYIKNNLPNNFIRPFKSPARTSIFFDQKPNGNLRLCIDYQSLNNLTIKNQYPLLLVRKSLDWLGQAWHFTQLDLTNTYYRISIKESDEKKIAFRTCYVILSTR